MKSHMKAALQSTTASLARSITKAASRQTYHTVALLVDRERTPDAYRAYAYFRWVDDWLDQAARPRAQREAFVRRQKTLIDECYAGAPTSRTTAEEQLLVDLIRGDSASDSGLARYVHNMMAVMAFDAERRGRLISQAELQTYQRSLAVAVTEALHYFIGHDQRTPQTDGRYLSVTAAHITHMLRDTHDDIRAGYFNVPVEFLRAHDLSPFDTTGRSFQTWVQMRAGLARRLFEAGRQYWAQVENGRCRLAAYAYMARLEMVLDVIEGDGYVLRPEYSGCKTLGSAVRMGWSVLQSTRAEAHPPPLPQNLIVP